MNAGMGCGFIQGEPEWADAAIILSSETLFAALFGYLLMGDRLNALGVAGCVLIFVCIIAVQLAPLIGARIQADGARS